MVTTRDDTIAAMQAIKELLDQRVEVWRIVINESGHEIGRVYRGNFIAPPEG